MLGALDVFTGSNNLYEIIISYCVFYVNRQLNYFYTQIRCVHENVNEI